MKQLIVLSVIIGGLGCSAPNSTPPPPQPPSESKPVKIHKGHKQHFKFMDHELVVYQISESSKLQNNSLIKIKLDDNLEFNIKNSYFAGNSESLPWSEKGASFTAEDEALFKNINFEEIESHDFDLKNKIESILQLNAFQQTLCQEMWKKLPLADDLSRKRSSFYILIFKPSGVSHGVGVQFNTELNQFSLIKIEDEKFTFGMPTSIQTAHLVINFGKDEKNNYRNNILITHPEVSRVCTEIWMNRGVHRSQENYEKLLDNSLLNESSAEFASFKKLDDSIGAATLHSLPKEIDRLYINYFTNQLYFDDPGFKRFQKQIRMNKNYKNFKKGVRHVIEK